MRLDWRLFESLPPLSASCCDKIYPRLLHVPSFSHNIKDQKLHEWMVSWAWEWGLVFKGFYTCSVDYLLPLFFLNSIPFSAAFIRVVGSEFVQKYLVAIASISSMKIMEGAFSRASRNTSLTIRGPSPKYFWTNSDPTTRMKAAEGRMGETWGVEVINTTHVKSFEYQASFPGPRNHPFMRFLIVYSKSACTCRRQGLFYHMRKGFKNLQSILIVSAQVLELCTCIHTTCLGREFLLLVEDPSSPPCN